MKLKKLTHEQREEIVMRAKTAFDSRPKEKFVDFMQALGSFNKIILELFEDKPQPNFRTGGLVSKSENVTNSIMLEHEEKLSELDVRLEDSLRALNVFKMHKL